jgi:hypothetical protein
MPFGLRSWSPFPGATAAERARIAAAERAASFSRRGAEENRKIVDAAQQKADFEIREALEHRRSADASQAIREAGVRRAQDDSLARRAVLAMRNTEYKERRSRGLEMVEREDLWAQQQVSQEAARRASVRQQRVARVEYTKPFLKASRIVESHERRRSFERRCASLDAMGEREQAKLEIAMRLLGKIEC